MAAAGRGDRENGGARTGCQSQVKAVLPGRTGGEGVGGRRASAATQGPQADAENPQPGCQPALAVCSEPLYRQKSPSREGAGSGGSYVVPEVRGSRGHRVYATNSTAGATLVRAQQEVKRAGQTSAPALLPIIFPGPTASRVVSLQWV